jgi:hypothetical protein
LFNIYDDPTEHFDVASKHPEIVQNLYEKIQVPLPTPTPFLTNCVIRLL